MTTTRALRSDEVISDLTELARIGLALSHEKDLAVLLEMIVTTARSLTGADAGTLYIVDRESRQLLFRIMQNDTTKTAINAVRHPDAPIPTPVPMFVDGAPNNANASSYVGLTGETVNIPDVYAAQGFNFSGVKTYDQVSGYRSKSMLVIAMKNHEGRIIGVLQLLNAREPGSNAVIGFSELDAVMVSSLASQAAVALTNNDLLARMKADLEEIGRLRDQEKELGMKLREAYIKTEQSNEELKTALDKVWVVRAAGFIFILLMAAIGGLSYAGGFNRNLFPNLQSLLAERPGPATTASLSVSLPVLKPSIQPITSSITLMGQIEPIRQVNVVSPFAGKIAETHFEYGREVKAGDVLLIIDPADVLIRFREAQAVAIRTDQNLRTLRTWESGSDLTRSKMNQLRCKASLDSLKRRLDETMLMFDKGIIPKAELESAQEAYDNQLMNDRAAEDEIKSLRERASPENLKIAEMEAKNAQARLAELQSQIDRAAVKAPVDGVVLKLAANANRVLEPGVAVEQGQGLVVIGNLDGISVRSQVDEINLGKIRVGQPVQVVGDGFPNLSLDGAISLISCQAAGGGAPRAEGARAPTFDVTVTVDSLGPDEKAVLRVGMSAAAQVTTYENPNAMVLPIEAVLCEADDYFVWRVLSGGGKLEKVPIQAGDTTIDTVEIVEGLSPDDLVAAHAEAVKP
jgi:HlyD family secretion protein